MSTIIEQFKKIGIIPVVVLDDAKDNGLDFPGGVSFTHGEAPSAEKAG